MKNTYLILLYLLLPSLTFAQKNFHKFSIGLGGGITANKGDLSSSQAKQLLIGNADYYLTPFIHGGVEAQLGKISGQDINNSRYFQNDFKSLIVSGKFHLGQFMDRNDNGYYGGTEVFMNTLKGLYGGIGAGVIKSNQTAILRDAKNINTRGTNSNKEIFIPVSVGIDNSGFNTRLIAGVRFQANYVLGDQIDGYYTRGSKNDFYSTVTLSVKYKFGSVGIF